MTAIQPETIAEDAAAPLPPREGRVLAIHGEQSLVEVEGGLYRCRLSGRLKRQRRDPPPEARPESRAPGSWQRNTREARGRWERSREHAPPSSPVAVGDIVQVRVDAYGNGLILERQERKSWLGRVRPTKGPQVIAANVEIALVVMAVARPEPDLFLLDQFLVQASAGGLEPWIIFNKSDLLDGDSAETGSAADGDGFAPARDYRRIGFPVYCTSALTREGIADLQRDLAGRTAVLAGPSGVGKSHLLNCLAPSADARIGEISDWSGRGQHTTTHVAMYPLPCGGYLVDAPGVRRLELWKVPVQDLCGYFQEFEPYLPQCQYHGCAHLDEAGCAVRAAAESNEIPWRRYRHYREMRG